MRLLISSITLFFINVSFAVAAVDSSKEKVISSLTTEPVGIGSYLQMFLGLFLVVGLIFGMAWFMRRLSGVGGMATGNLKVLGGISVGQRERVVLVQAGNTQLLIGVAPGQIRMLHVMDEPITAVADTTSKPSQSFAEKLHAAIKSRNKI